MSCIIKRNELTEKEAQTIKDLLTLKPEVSYLAKMNYGVKADPIPFFYKDGDDVHIPMFFAKCLRKEFINDKLDHKKIDVKFTGKLFEHQVAVAEEAVSQLEDHRGSIVGLYPGFGKTVIGACLTAKMGLLSCVVCHRSILMDQWKKTFESFTDASKIWIVEENKVLPEEAQVIIVMDTRVSKIPPEVLRSIGMLILDEVHCLTTQSRVVPLLSFTPRYTVAMSATLERDDKMERMVYSLCGKQVISKISSRPFTVYKFTTGVSPEVELGANGSLNYGKMVSSLCSNPHRNAIIKDIVAKNPDKKIIILTNLVDHVKTLLTELREVGEKVDFLAGSKKSYKECRVLVGTVSKIGTGFDPSTSCGDFDGVKINLLILATSIKKEQLLDQNCGRVFRAELPTIYHLVDNHAVFKRHWGTAKKWYLSRSGEIKDLNA